jgi:UDP-2,3-diacylglucosamine pyrophosphatase LpxH
MTDKPVTIIVSDLHVGGGPQDPGDDHVYNTNQLVKFLQELGAEEAGRNGQVELIINGDFLEFAQVVPGAYAMGSAKYWCSQAESLQKVEAILEGHKEIFDALKVFQSAENLVTIAAGNHDVDIYWPVVQDCLRAAAGPVHFEIGHETYSRYDGRLIIGHGHMFDPANRFTHWDNPILPEPSGDDRLEMCPGTLFMVKFVNWLESQYPFADNIKPVTALGRLLWKEKKLGFLAMAWVLAKFVARHPVATLETPGKPPDIARIVRQSFELNPEFKNCVVSLYQKAVESNATPETVTNALQSDEGMERFLRDVMGKVSPDNWLSIFDMAVLPNTLSADRTQADTLAIVGAGFMNEKEALRKKARELFLCQDVQVVVFGHTHQPDKFEENGKQYFNPGSWTRYLAIEDMQNITLNDLRNEADFPYQLNFIRVEQASTDRLHAELHCFETQDGKRFKGSRRP